MKVLHFAALALLSVPAFAVDTPPPAHITPNATVYVAPRDDGFDTDLKAAILKKHVPLVLIDDQGKAEYVIKGAGTIQHAGWAKTMFVSPLPEVHANIVLTDKNGAILYAYSVDKNSARKGLQSAAEACAKHLKEDIEKGK